MGGAWQVAKAGKDQKGFGMEFPVWPSRLRIRYSVHGDVGSIPSLTQWVKDPALLQAAV